MQLPLSYLDASAIEEVPVDLWRTVFDELGWPSSLDNKRATFSHRDVQEAIRNDDLTDNLLQALETLHTLGTDEGREAITSIMRERRIEPRNRWDGASERELSLQLHLAQRSDASLSDVLARAQAQIQETGDRRRYNEFLAKKPRLVRNLDDKRKTLCDAVLHHCKASDLGDHVQVEAFEDDGDYVFSILRTDRMKKPLAVLPGRSARTLIPFRPVHCDILRYEVSLGRLRIAVRVPSMVEFYRTTLGGVLFADEDFFSGESVCSLSVLQERGRAALDDHDVFGVGRVMLTECVWECGDRSLIELRDKDCFRLIERHGLSLAEGRLVQAKLKVDVIGKSTRPVIVNIRVPSRIEVSRKTHERLIDELLDAIGIRKTADPARQADLWSLYPWRHHLSSWREVFGDATDTLVESGVLRRVELRAVQHPDHPNAGRVLRVERIAEGEYQGVSELSEVPSRALSATDVEGLELEPERFRQHVRDTLSITAGGCTWKTPDEVLELGWLPVGDERLYLAYAMRPPQPEVGARLRIRSDGAPVVLIVPATRPKVVGFATVSVSLAIPSNRQVLLEGTQAYGLADRLPAIVRAPPRAELVVDLRLKKVWVCGNEVHHILPDSQLFQFVEILAGSNNAPVSCDEITRALSAARLRTDGTTTARQVKMRAKKLIVEELKAAGSEDTSDPFPTAGTGCYRCRLLSFVC